MKIIILLSSLLFCFHFHGNTQETPEDSSKVLEEITLRSFEQNRSLSNTTASVRVVEINNADRSNKISLVDGFNSIAGVRMEERSPGSYRINIRGSSLRSPFGVRNVKVYWDNIPVTDPGGNTYFNQFAYNNFSFIEISKGPASSLYGAGTGGLILMNNLQGWSPGLSAEYIFGSYNTHSIITSARFGKKENRNQITFAHNSSDGYRVQTKLRRDNASWISRMQLTAKHQLTASILFTDMEYQTPGALTLAEYNNDPKLARPAAGIFPSAVAAKAAIYQKNVLAGFTNEFILDPKFKNTTTFYGAFAQIKNPTIRNYERRNEPHFGGRSIFTYNKKEIASQLQFLAGAEFQKGFFNTLVSNNRNGNPDTIQTNDDIINTIYNFFVQGDLQLNETWFVTAGASLNSAKLEITRLNKYPVITQTKKYQNEFMPRVSVLKKWGDVFGLRFTLSKGFSPPTTAEVLPSTGVISTDLEAEQGWNYELGIRSRVLKNKLYLELIGFYFRLDNALVQRRDLSGADFFVNSGDVKQKGIEFIADYFTTFYSGSFADYFSFKGAYTFNKFRYGTFIRGTDDFSGKYAPSVPKHSVAVQANLYLKNGLYTEATFYAASKIYLNDANTAIAEGYQLLGWRIGWKKTYLKKHRIGIYAGADNLFDQKYSLGNDINAPAGRYYNAAPRLSYYGGIMFQLRS